MTSEEIVKSLRCCAEIGECEKCVIDPEESWDTCRKRDAEAADLIERLEKEKAALLEYAKKSARCDVVDCFQCVEDCPCKKCKKGSKWEWKGLEDGNGTTNL